jgi:hypothetical protein
MPKFVPLTRLFSAWCVLPLSLLALAVVSAALAADIPLHGSTQIHCASPQEAADILGQVDQFVRQMGPLERQLRLGADGPVTQDAYLEFTRQQALGWLPEEVRRLTGVIVDLRPKLAELRDLWPARVVLVKSTGREEGQAPHCRGDAIVLPARSLQQPPAALERLVLHELFHILSRQSAPRRTQLYAIVGFRTVPPLTLPAAWQPRRITNPDAPEIDCVISLRHEQQTLHLAPILLTKQAAYDNIAEKSLFGELMFRLMPVQLDLGQQRWVPAVVAEEDRLWEAEQLPEYGAKIGRNTSYIIHPEEILAENFVHLMTGTADLPDPWVVERLGQLLTERAP